MFAHNPNKIVFAKTHRQSHELSVNPHLAYDLKEVDSLIRKGKSVSSTNLQNSFYDGNENCTCNIPLDMQRGVDINDLWNESLRHNKAISKLKSSNVNLNIQ